jgi:transposase-like protein
MKQKRSAEEGRKIIEEFERSGSSRRAFCERMNIPVTTLDYWRWKNTEKTRLVEVAIEKQAPSSKSESSPGFIVVLTNGRRIESPWTFHEAELSSLIRIVESA